MTFVEQRSPPNRSDLQGLAKAKFRRPRLSRSIVVRPRLIRALNDAVDCPLVVVTAPAGQGKSTTVSQWLAQIDLPYVWLTLDEHDSDSTAFLTSVVTGLNATFPHRFQASLESLESPAESSPVVLDSIFEELQSLDTPFVLVLDEGDKVRSAFFDSFLIKVAETAPPGQTLVVLTRLPPDLPYHQLMAYEQVTLLRANDLAFTADESREFLNRRLPPGIDPAFVDRLIASAEGWAVGLQLLAASAQDQHQTPHPIDERDLFSDEAVMGYLFSEVLSSQSPAVQQFLLETSLFEIMSPELCNRLTGRQDSARILASLANSNTFTVALDRHGEFYRYHRLFKEALYRTLGEALSREELRGLHGRVSMLLEESSSVEWAADHAIMAEDWDRASVLVHTLLRQWHFEDRLQLIQRWSQRLPENILLGNPELGYWHSWALARLGLAAEAEKAVLAFLEHHDGDEHRWRFKLVFAYLQLLTGNWREGLRVGIPAVQAIPEQQHYDQAIGHFVLSLLLVASGDVAAAQPQVDRGRELIDSSRLKPVWLQGVELTVQGRIQFSRLRVRSALSIFQHVLLLANRTNPQVVQYAHSLHAHASLHQLDLESVQLHCQDALTLAEILGTRIHISPILQTLAEADLLRGNIEAAAEKFGEAISIAETNGVVYQVRDAKARQARFWLDQGLNDLAFHWANGPDVKDREVGDPYRLFDDVIAARVLIAENRPDDAIALAETLLEIAIRDGRGLDEIEVRVILAGALQRADREMEADDHLHSALMLARDESLILSFLQHGSIVAPLLERQRGNPDTGVLVEQVLLRLSHSPAESASDRVRAMLTPRELQVMTAVSLGKSNQEIADEFFISETTVKKHLRNIFGKLQVKSRTQAMAVFRDSAHLFG